MLAKISLDQALMKARSFSKKNKVVEAKKIYNAIITAFPNNIRALQELAALSKTSTLNTSQTPPQEVINDLINIYNQGQI